MENKENKPNKDQNDNSPTKPMCCSDLFATYDENGKKRPSPLVWAVLAVILIGGIGIISSTKNNEKELIKNLNEETQQLQRQAGVFQTALALKNKAKDAKDAKATPEANKEDVLMQKMKEMQKAHYKQMEQAKQAFESLQADYTQKLNQVVKSLQAEQEAKEQQVPNPELNFQLRGLSNIKVQFNKAKDISNIEIIQPENCKSYGKNKKYKYDSYPKQNQECDEGEYKDWKSINSQTNIDCPESKCCPMTIKQREKQWDCMPETEPESDCSTY